MRKLVACAGLLCTCFSAAVNGQTPPAVRSLGQVVRASRDTFGVIGGVRQLSDGRLLVNETSRRRLVLLDRDLASTTVIADSVGSTVRAYGPKAGGLFAYLGDSSLFVDPVGMAILVIDPSGGITRLVALPQVRDAAAIVSQVTGIAGTDSKGRLIYSLAPASGGITLSRGVFTMVQAPDSAPVLRADLSHRTIDTVGTIKVAAPKTVMVPGRSGRPAARSLIDPLPKMDGWAVLSSGTTAIVRGGDYHVDFVSSDGTTKSAPKVPFAWQRISDSGKVALIDTLRRSFAQSTAPDPSDRGGAAREVLFVEPSDLPDYLPPFRQGAVRSDQDNNVWVLTTSIPTKAAGLSYDVLSSAGELSDRVLIPPGRTLVGFGKGGVVYLAAAQGRGRYVIERRLVQ